ncbi:MAG TPA: hypothetical protein VIW67_15600 [Terriglobales bacterium]
MKPLSGGKTIYLFEGDEPRVLGKSGLYSCGSNGHIVVIPTERNGILQMSETNSVPAAPGKKRFLNTWKEIATYMGRGVRTVQRWERELDLPVRRPRGKSRSAVIALAADLDEWLYRAPVGLEDSNGDVIIPESEPLQRTG